MWPWAIFSWLCQPFCRLTWFLADQLIVWVVCLWVMLICWVDLVGFWYEGQHIRTAVLCWIIEWVPPMERPPKRQMLDLGNYRLSAQSSVGSDNCWAVVRIVDACGTHTHTHTHTFNGPLSGTTQVSRYQKGKTSLDFTEARDSEWQWHQLAGPCARLHIAPDR